ncbi:MAG: nucleotide exchange factor GrpE [Peptococcaceae bacterium]|nr:nucleotide exchange factor GrpE [Peptococcaceae bacterium]
MVDFKTELDKLLAQENEPLPQGEFMELATVWRQLLLMLNRKHTDISMQIEEIYDITQQKDTGVLQEALRAAKEQEGRLVQAAVGLCDLIDDFCVFAGQSDSEALENQALMMQKKANALLEKCAMIRLGEEGQPLNPEIHTVRAAVPSSFPREYVACVLQSGYRYLGSVMCKAIVAASLGEEAAGDASTGDASIGDASTENVSTSTAEGGNRK